MRILLVMGTTQSAEHIRIVATNLVNCVRQDMAQDGVSALASEESALRSLEALSDLTLFSAAALAPHFLAECRRVGILAPEPPPRLTAKDLGRLVEAAARNAETAEEKALIAKADECVAFLGLDGTWEEAAAAVLAIEHIATRAAVSSAEPDVTTTVTSTDGKTKYSVLRRTGRWSCTCKAFRIGKKRGERCKHIDAVSFSLEIAARGGRRAA